MQENRRKYTLKKEIRVNGILIREVIIDPHVDKHSDHITDNLIVSLVKLLDEKLYSSTIKKDNFSYYLSRVLYKGKVYRLIWLQENGQFYVGVITSFKEKGAKHDVP